MKMLCIAHVSDLANGILLAAFINRNQIESQERKGMLAQRTVKINDTMHRNLEDESGPHQTESFLALGTDGDLNRASSSSNADARARTCSEDRRIAAWDNYSRQVETTTMNVFGFSCKTSGCQAWLKVGELPEDSARSIHFPINLGEDPRRRQCPDCGQARDYYFAEKEIRRLVQEPREEASLISSRRLRS